MSDENDDGLDDQLTVSGSTCGTRSLMIQRNAETGYVAEATLYDGYDALLSLDEPTEGEIALLRELLVSKELIRLMRAFVAANPGFAAGHPDLAQVREVLLDYEEYGK